MVIQGKNVTHIIHQELRLLMNYTNTGKGWVFLFGFFFFVRYWDNTTYGKLKQWRQPANETKVMCKKKKIKPKVSHTSFFISKDQNQIIQIFNYTFQQKCKLIKRGDNCELTLSEVLCSWPQTDFSFFVSVCS